MSRYGRDPDAIMRDIIISLWHPDYRDQPCIEALRELRARRRDESV